MGLDMYLEKYPKGIDRKTVDVVENFVRWVRKGLKHSFGDWCGGSAEDLPDAETLVNLLGMVHTTYPAWDDEKRFPDDTIHEEIGYWRKANAIHRWFVDRVQDGEDDCRYHRPVTKDDIESLFEACRTVLADHGKASKVLPAQSGFFFGGTEYDEWYFEDIQNTADLCKQIIDDFDFDNYDLYYVSSW